MIFALGGVYTGALIFTQGPFTRIGPALVTPGNNPG
jgi:hypothetical protein